jgi:polysaccharide biosynthesis transport protein
MEEHQLKTASHALPQLSRPASESASDLDVWSALIRHKVAASAVALTLFVAAIILSLGKTPTYQSDSLILIENQVSVPVSGENSAPPKNNDSKENSSDLSTEIEILKSPSLLAKALRSLDPQYRVYSVQEIAANLTLRQVGDANVLMVSYTDTNPERNRAIVAALVSTYVTYSKESKRSPVTNAIRFIEEQLPDARKKLNDASMAITVFRKKNNVDDPDSSAARAVQSQAELKQQLQSAEIALRQTGQTYQQLLKQVSANGQDSRTIFSDAILSQDTTYQKLVTQLRESEAQYALAQTQFQPNHPRVRELKANIGEIQLLLQAQIRRILGGKQSKAAGQSVPTGTTQQSLAQKLLETQTTLVAQTAQVNGLRKAEVDAGKNVQKQLAPQQTYKDLQRQYEASAQVVNNFLAKLNELRVREAQETSSWKILEPPYLPTLPISPNLKRDALVGAVISLLAGVGIAMLLEKLDRRLKRVEEVKELSGLPILGIVPEVYPSLLSRFKPNAAVPLKNIQALTESMRSTALVLQSKGLAHSENGEGKIFMLVSSISREGKTTLISRLGIALAELGKKVLIVDADFYSPSIHRIFGVANANGLTTVLQNVQPWQNVVQTIAVGGQAINLESVEQRKFISEEESVSSQNDRHSVATSQPIVTTPYTPITRKQLDVMSSGLLTDQSISLLSSLQLSQLLQELRESYDCVLIDTPGILQRFDAQCLVPYVDGGILVAGLRRSTPQALTRAMEILRTCECNFMGAVVNFAPTESFLDEYP